MVKKKCLSSCKLLNCNEQRKRLHNEGEWTGGLHSLERQCKKSEKKVEAEFTLAAPT